MKQLLSALMVIISLVLVDISAGVAKVMRPDELSAALLRSAPWLEYRVRLYENRMEIESSPEIIRQEIFDRYVGSAVGHALPMTSISSPSLTAVKSGMQVTEFDPFVRVQKSDSLGRYVNFAINTVSNRILIVWQDSRNGIEDTDIYGQILDLNYDAIGANFKINPASELISAQISPDVCALADGRFLVCWENNGIGAPQIMAQRINSNGTLLGAAITVAPITKTPQYFPKVDAYGDSTHIVWLQYDEGTDYNIYIRTFNLQGVGQAAAVRVNDDDESSWQDIPDIANYGDGQTIVVWEDKRTGNSEIMAQIYKVDGVKRGDNFLVNRDPAKSLQWQPAVAGNSSMAQVVWEDFQFRADAIFTQQIDRFGLLNGVNQRLDQLELTAEKKKPYLFVDELGQRVFAWQERSADAWRLKFALYPAASNLPVYYTLGNSDPAVEFTDIKLSRVKNAVYFAFLGQPIGGTSTVLCHRVNFTTVPVELAAFQAKVEASKVHLSWRTASESTNLGFEVERMHAGNGYQRIAFVHGYGTASTEQLYQYDDRDLTPGTYHYRLQQIDLDGTTTTSEAITVTIAGPAQFELQAAYPNPFQEQTQLQLRLAESSEVLVLVYNLLGQQVRRITAGTFPPGRHLMHWDGRDDAGRPLPAGEYIVQAWMGERMHMRRVCFLR